MKNRTEKDSLGTIHVPFNAYYGSFTARAAHNFQISGIQSPAVFIHALGTVKLASAQTNQKLKLIGKKDGKAIETACREFIAGKFIPEFFLDVFQAGAGTSYNMNANEIIANRANEILKAPKGSYKFVHPNNHVNMGQSTNDVMPTATRIAILFSLPELLKALVDLEKSFEKIAKKYRNLLKVGRTHLQDAVPITLGQEFDSYKEALGKSRKFISTQSGEMQILGIGGTAVGTGINTHPKYQKTIVAMLTKLTGIHFTSGKNLTEMANNMNGFMNFSAALRSLATNLLNIANDLKLMNMGPMAGLGEITLPEVQPGSSIMPGKVNPSIPESLEMVCLQVMGNDQTVSLAAQKSNFELNVFCPIIMYNILQSMEILKNGINTFRIFCLDEMLVNKSRITYLLESSLVNATALAPYLGYNQTADIVKTALKEKRTLREEVLKRKIYTPAQLNKILSSKHTTRPAKIEKDLIR